MTLSAEIKPGLVLHLDPVALENAGGSTEVVAALKVQASHFFVVLGSDGPNWRILPCYTTNAPDRSAIDASQKSGHPKWTTGTTYFHPKQVWVASNAAVEAAAVSGGDLSKPGRRNWVDIANVKNLPSA